MRPTQQEDMLQEIFNGKCTAPKVYFIGIKGTGMCALAQFLRYWGYDVSGSDVEERFYTEELLHTSGIPYYNGFAIRNLPMICDLIIYSAAYNSSNPEYTAAQHRKEKGEWLMLSYPEALGYISQSYQECLAIIGVHGKTTSTLLCSAMMQSLGLESSAIAGAGAPHLKDNAFFMGGRKLLAVEACEYRNHFFQFDPTLVLLTSLEWDHQDFFTTYSMMQDSFRNFISKESVETVVYCADDPGARELLTEIMTRSVGLRLVPYGLGAGGDFAVGSVESGPGETVLRLSQQPEFPLRLKVPGEHLALNALGALAALFYSDVVQQCYHSFTEFLGQEYERITVGLQNFCGATRRSELLGTIPWGKGNVLVLDDYAHHPTAVCKTLVGLKRFYPERRLVLDFMSHTYSRTMSLHNEFSHCFEAADVLILHDIYDSARERRGDKAYSGQTLWQAVNELREEQVYYFPQPLDALPVLEEILQAGDLFVTMGAGNNRQLAESLLLTKGDKP